MVTETTRRPVSKALSASVQPLVRKRRDVTRLIAWSATALVSSALLWGGYVWKPRPEVAVLMSCAEMEVKLGLFDVAHTSLAEALEREPEHPYANLLMGHVLQQRREFRSALDHLLKGKAAIETTGNPSFMTDWLVNVGFLRLACRDFRGAEQVANEVFSREPTRASAYVLQAFSRLGARDENGYRRAIAKAYALDPGDIAFRMDRDLVTTAMPWAHAVEVRGGWDTLSSP